MGKATPFRTLLVANRGEIAKRILTTARAMGLRTVAVYSAADAESGHLTLADKAVLIGGPAPAESYLDIAAIVEAAKRSGAEAVHPGYGFLAENAAFARAVREAGLVFVGPAPEAIEAMGDKARAKAVMAAAGVPVVPGYQGEDQGDERLAAEAARLGYPVMIKAVAGGGGRGMRLVPEAALFADMLRTARSEASHAFGDDRVLIEKAVIEPRHIEIQVFGDRHGNAVHFGERDCSVERRHQKLVEEAPSPAVSPELRRRMGEVSVQAVKALGYEGAGTLEFLLDAEGRFYFMEMNTRLQVEHRVTEMNAGRDFVEWQLRIAAGERLPHGQDQVVLGGHSIEVRLCAEDPAQDFVPRSGRFRRWSEPRDNVYPVRVDTVMASGVEVTPYYDSMVAKVIAHGLSREEARRLLVHWLSTHVALGVPTNQAFLKRVLEHPAFVAGEATTGFVARHREALLAEEEPAGLPDAALAAAILYDQDTAPAHRGRRRHLGPPLPVPMVLEVDGVRREVAVHRDRDGRHVIALDGDTVAVAIEEGLRPDEHRPPDFRFVHEGVTQEVPFAREGDDLFIQRGTRQVRVRDLTRAPAKAAGAGAGDGRLVAAMSGRVVAVHVAPGDAVAAGAPIATLEAMKMEHVHAAPAAGRVAEIAVAAGEQVAAGRLIARIE